MYINILFDCHVLHNPAFGKWKGFMLSCLCVMHLSIPDLQCSES